MNIVEKAVKKVGSQVKLAKLLTEMTGHKYQQGHVGYWKRTGYFPADLAVLVARELFDNEYSPSEICPKIKRSVAV